MSVPVAECGFPVLISTATTTTVSAGPCQCLGFYVSSTTGGTIVIQDGASAITGTITPAIGFHRFCPDIGSSLKVVTANTISVTFFYATAN